jgi:hypothetical protein
MTFGLASVPINAARAEELLGLDDDGIRALMIEDPFASLVDEVPTK